MPHEVELFDRITLRDVTLAEFDISWFRRPRIKVLVVVDGGISYSPASDFGVSRFIRLLRETTVGCTWFEVDVADRNLAPFADNGAGGEGHLRYPGFRFNSTVGGQLVLDRYHELFLFGFNSDTTPGPFSVGAASGAEQSAIAGWMDAGGGIFATGDHEELGATLAAGVPRVRNMRRWTNADGVPPVGGTTRIDTNQPANADQLAGNEVIGFDVQSDAVPQPISWIPEAEWFFGPFVYRRPHPVLCHPSLGPIDVMPDHPHEGICFTRGEIESDPTRRADFPGSELPRVVATGQVVPDPPYQHVKGNVVPRTIPMVSVYDGRAEGVGRAVVDSTWHHWFDVNVVGLEAAGGAAWQKIARYFLNVAVWIAPPGAYQARCWWELLVSHFAYPGIEEYHPKAGVLDLGAALRGWLKPWHGPCNVRDGVFTTLSEIAPALYEVLRLRLESQRPEPQPWRTFPDLDEVELVVLGGMVRGTVPLAQKLRSALAVGEPVELAAADVRAAALHGAVAALTEYSATVVKSSRQTAEAFAGPIGIPSKPSA